MAFINSIQALMSGILQFDYAGQSVGNVLTSGTGLVVNVQGTTAVSSIGGVNQYYLDKGMFRLKLYGVTGTGPTWSFSVYANSVTTGELLFQSPAYAVGAALMVDVSHIFQTDQNISSFIIMPTGGGTSPTGTLDFEYAGCQ